MSEFSPHLDPQSIRLLPLGGLGEIGLNMLVLEHGGELLIIDCGLMFPEASMLGIDLVIPDISILEQRRDDIRAILLTHGHEDHIGALPFHLENLGFPPIYGTTLTLGLLEGKLKEHQLLSQAMLHPTRVREPFSLGDFEIEFFRAAHSIVDGAGLAIRTPAGLIVHTGDFKLDQTPVDGEKTDLARLAEYGEDGVLLLLSDSTNVEKEGFTLSERSVGESLRDLFPRCRGRVIAATFSSNIHRLQQLIDAGTAAGRKVHVNGRSMVANIATARQLGYLQAQDETFVTRGQLRDLEPEESMILTTGSQGEPLSALTRIAMDDHKQLQIEPGDTVILSSKFIPGNEKAIAELINHLYRRGAEVNYEKTSEIHVSGHASQEELKIVLGLVKPKFFIPIHGEYRHLVKHSQLAQQVGLEPSQTRVIENGEVLRISSNGVQSEGQLAAGKIFVDGKGVGDVGHMELRDRRHLAHHGLVTVVLAINQANGTIIFGPELFARGFATEEMAPDYLDQAAQVVRTTLSEHSLEAVADWDEIRVEVRKGLRRFFNRTIDRRPLILPVILEL